MPKTSTRCAVSRCAPAASRISGPTQRGKQRRAASPTPLEIGDQRMVTLGCLARAPAANRGQCRRRPDGFEFNYAR
jgi:hypothetical protein